MASRDADLRLSFAIDQARAKAAIKSVGGLDKTVKDLDGSLKTLAKTAGTTGAAVGSGLKRFSAEQVTLRNELLKGTRALKEQVTVLDLYKQKLAATQQPTGGSGGGVLGKLGSTGGAIGAVLSGAGAGQLGQIASLGGQLGNAINQLQQVSAVVQGVGASGASAVPGVAGATASLGALAVAAPLVIVALIALSEAIKKFTSDVEQGKRNVSGAIEAQKTYYELLQTGTTESINAQLAELKVKQAVAAQIRADVQRQIDAQKEQFGLLGGIVSDFTGLSDELKKADEETQDLSFQINAYTRALTSNQVAQNDAKKAQEDLNRQTAQNTQAIVDVREQSAKQEADILAASAQRRIDLAQQTARAEADALTRLRADISEGAIRASQQQQDILIAYQDNEKKAARDHYRAMLKIRKDADNDEFDLILQRDFSGLAKLRRQTDQRLQEEEDRHKEERAQRLTDLKIRLRDQQAAFVREREARQRAYVQQISDLRQGLSRQLEDSNQSARVELENLQKKLQAEITMKQQANALLLQLEAAYQARRRAMIEEGAGYISGYQSTPRTGVDQLNGSQIRHMASGGSLRAGEISTVNERRGQAESFSALGRSAKFPGGMGLFMPLQTGRVDPGGAGTRTLNATFNIYDAYDARKVAKQMDIQLAKAFEKLVS